MDYKQVIIRALNSYIEEMQRCADIRDAEGNEEARQIFACEVAEARLALFSIKEGMEDEHQD